MINLINKRQKDIEVFMRKLVLITIATVFTSSCYVTSIRFQPSDAVPGPVIPDRTLPVQSVKFVSKIFGVYPKTSPVHPDCKSGQVLDNVIFEMDALDTVIHFIAGGIYTRRQVKVYCR